MSTEIQTMSSLREERMRGAKEDRGGRENVELEMLQDGFQLTGVGSQRNGDV